MLSALILSVLSRRLPQIFFHRFWSVIIAESLKRFKDYTQAPDAQMMPILVMSLPWVKKATIKFPHVGQIPFSMLANIPKDNPLLLAHNQKHQVFVRREYDMTLVNLADTGGSKGIKRKVPETFTGKPAPRHPKKSNKEK